jgi:hypothetical protein
VISLSANATEPLKKLQSRSAEQARGNFVEQELFPFGCLEPSHVAASWVLGDEQDAVEVGSDCVQVADDGDQAAGGDVAAEHVECFGEDRCVEGAETLVEEQ